MSQIITKFIADNAVDNVKIRLQNAGYMRSRNAANSADINILRVNSSDQVEFAFLPYYSGSQLATQAYADTAGKLKQSVVAVSSTNILLDGSVTTVDGVSLSNGDRVLVAGQTAPADNGIYIVAATPWARSSDLSVAGQFGPGVSVIALDGGTSYGDTLWSDQEVVVTLGTDPITFKLIGSSATAFANRSLSNLTSPTAINQALLPDTAGGRDIGSAILPWNNAYLEFVNVSNSALTASIGALGNDGSDNVLLQSSSSNALKLLAANAMNMTATTGDMMMQASAGNVTLKAIGSGKNVVLDPTPGDGGFIDASSSLISNVLNPVSAQDAATKFYVDNMAQGLSWKQVMRSATTGALPAYGYVSGVITESSNGALPAQDGVTLVNGDRLLVKDETAGNAPFNGLYVVTDVGSGGTPFILTRSSDAATANELTWATVEIGNDATSQAGYIFRESLTITTIGTDNAAFALVSQGLNLTVNNGLTQTGNVIDVAPGDASLVVSPGSVAVQRSATGAIDLFVDGIAVKVEASNPSLAIVADELGLKMDPAGALSKGAAGVAVGVDGATTKINGSNQVEALAPNFSSLTLNGTDITNQYKDLAVLASALSIMVVVSGVMQTYGVDYTISTVGGVSRITFAGDLATGGPAALVSGDVLNVSFEYLQ